MCSYNLTAIQPKSHESGYSIVQDDNLKHESTCQIKISCIMRLYLECTNKYNYTYRRLFRRRLQASYIYKYRPTAKETNRYLQFIYKYKQSIYIYMQFSTLCT